MVVLFMELVTEENVKKISVSAVVEMVNDWGAEIVKIIENPNPVSNNELRIYVDNFMFINAFELHDLTVEDKFNILKGINCEHLLYLVDHCGMILCIGLLIVLIWVICCIIKTWMIGGMVNLLVLRINGQDSIML